MTLLDRVPPGRSGRLWLQRRYRTAQRGREQLDRRLHILLPELARLQADELRCRQEWVAAWAEAQVWQVRVGVLGGRDAIRAGAAAVGPVELDVGWQTLLGVRHPARVDVGHPPVAQCAGVGNAALPPASAAFGSALIGGARAAVAAESVRRMQAEVASTRRRVRALDTRWLPALRAAIARLDLALEEAEREDGTRLRRALAADSGFPARRTGPAGPTPFL